MTSTTSSCDSTASSGFRTIRATGEFIADDVPDLLLGHYDICLMTYEKFGHSPSRPFLTTPARWAQS